MSNTFKPIKVGLTSLSNRLAMAPMTRLRAPNHVPTDTMVEYYRQRASGEPGTLLITEGTIIAPQAGGYPTAPGIWNDKQVSNWAKVTSAVHDAGSNIFAQLWTIGRNAYPKVLKAEGDFAVVGPGDVPTAKGPTPRPLSKDEINEYLELYKTAATNAMNAGFDGVEIHGANGYLVDQFLSQSANNRTDEYGGSIRNRCRFPLEIIDAVSETIGAERTAARFSPWSTFQDISYGDTPHDTFTYLVNELENRGLDGDRLAYLHVVEPRADTFTKGQQVSENVNNDFIRNLWQGILIRNGGFGHDIEEIHNVLERDDRLLISIGRYSTSNPEFVRQIKHNEPLDMYNRKTFYWNGQGDSAIGYTKNL